MIRVVRRLRATITLPALPVEREIRELIRALQDLGAR